MFELLVSHARRGGSAGPRRPARGGLALLAYVLTFGITLLVAPSSGGAPPKPKEAVPEKRIYVDLSSGRVYAVTRGRVVREIITNPGAGRYATRPGVYSITEKVRSGKRSNLWDVHNRPLGKGQESRGAPMPYWMRLGRTGQGFHQSSLWSPTGRPASHGCLRLSREGARWLFTWAPKGTPVHVLANPSYSRDLTAMLPEWQLQKVVVAQRLKESRAEAAARRSTQAGGSKAGSQARRSAKRRAGATPAAGSTKPRKQTPKPRKPQGTAPELKDPQRSTPEPTEPTDTPASPEEEPAPTPAGGT